MFIGHFTERPYQDPKSGYFGATGRSLMDLGMSNASYDPKLGADLYNRYLDERVFAEEMGFDGLMLNEHHNTPTCMGAAMNLEAAILARATKNAKIVLLGNPLPISDNPVRMAEELAEIDLISRGRLVSGFVRGTGVESWATNTNPVHNRERFQEAHDLIIKTWTTPGPFRWEGRHYEYRVVNPFVRPLQQPHPPVWVPGSASPETMTWAARRHYPYVFLEADPEVVGDAKAIYAEAANEVGYEPGPQNFGYLFRVHVQDTDEKAYEVGKGFLAGNAGVGRVPMPPEYMNPPGYTSRQGRQRSSQINLRPDRLVGGVDAAGYDRVVGLNRIVVGSPDTVVRKLREVLSVIRPGILAVWTNDGSISHEDTMRCLELMDAEVLPALRELGDELELPGPFEVAP